MTAEGVDPFALLTATQASRFAGVSVEAILNWRKRGHLPVAARDGKPILDGRGKNLYFLVDVAKADAKTAARSEQMARALARRTAAA